MLSVITILVVLLVSVVFVMRSVITWHYSQWPLQSRSLLVMEPARRSWAMDLPSRKLHHYE
jgi:hypothetical protein